MYNRRTGKQTRAKRECKCRRLKYIQTNLHTPVMRAPSFFRMNQIRNRIARVLDRFLYTFFDFVRGVGNIIFNFVNMFPRGLLAACVQSFVDALAYGFLLAHGFLSPLLMFSVSIGLLYQ